MGWLVEAKVSCIVHHRSVQLILAYSWAKTALLAAGKGRGGMFLFLLFLHFHSFSPFVPVPLPTDTGLQLGKACYPCSSKGIEGIFYFYCFFTFISVPLSSLSLSFISSTISFLPLSGRQHKMTHKGWRVNKPKHNQISLSSPLLSLFSLSLGDDTKWPTRVDVLLNPNTINDET